MKTIINSIQPELQRIFAHLHNHPEVSWEEQNTTKYIRSLVDQFDCKITIFEHMTGIVVEVGQGKPIIALRADMDAIWQEIDGKFRANHSCGHDAHMTIAIGAFLTMIKIGVPKKGTFRFIFQPAEEKGTGALAIIETGIVDDVDFLYGMHLRPVEELKHGQFSTSIEHGAAKFIKGYINEEDAHAARPHLNVNSIQVGTDFFRHLHDIQINPMIPHSIKMTAFHAGGKSGNIIPGNAKFTIDIRSQTNETMELLTEKVRRISNMLTIYYDVEIALKVDAQIAAAVLHKEAIEIMSEAIISSVGKGNLVSKLKTTGGDDFHFYSLKRPNIKATMFGIGCDLKPGLHHPKMTFRYEVIPKAVEIVTRALITTAARYS